MLLVGCNSETNQTADGPLTITSDLEKVVNVSGDLKFETNNPNFYIGGGGNGNQEICKKWGTSCPIRF